MKTVSESTLPTLDEVSSWSPQETVDRLAHDRQVIARLQSELRSSQQQFDWLRRQAFGQKSERRLP
jgi:transposase